MAPAEASAAVSLIEEARSLTRRPGGTCLVARLLPVLGTDLEDALASDVTSAALSLALKNRGTDLPAQCIARHRRGDCRCRP